MRFAPPARLLSLLTLGWALSLHLAAAEPASPAFWNLNFAHAATRAAAEQKIVFIDFYTTWCGPCKELDRTTWLDPQVIELLQTKAVALKIDAEKEADLATRYKIAAYPTLLLLKPDGTEIDRIVGYRPAGKFIEAFNAGLAGKGSAARAQEAVTNAVTPDSKVKARYELGQSLAGQGRHAEALVEFLWCYDEGMAQAPAYAGVRNSFLLGDIEELADAHPPARAALVERRDRLQQAFLANPGDRRAPRDLGALNHALGEDDKTLALLDQLPATDKNRRALGMSVLPLLLKARRHADALSVQPYDQMVRMAGLLTAPRGADQPAEALAAERRFQIQWFGDRLEILAGANDLEHAREFLAKARAYDASAEANTVYLASLTKGGHAELLTPPATPSAGTAR